MSASKRNYVVALLLETPPTAADLAECFPGLTAAEDELSLAGFLGDSETARLVVETLPHPWPDSTDLHDRSAEEFGLGTEPWGLQRSLEQCWVWDTASAAVSRHQAVVRVRRESTGAEGGVLDTPQVTARDVTQLIRQALAAATLPGVLAYFQPAGEVLLPPHVVAEMLEHATIAQIPPLDLWSNIRLSWLTDDWSLVETIGNIQLGLPDVEVYYEHDRQETNDVAALARSVSLRMLQEESAPKTGESFETHAGGRFVVKAANENLLPPNRPIARLLPEDGGELPEDLARRLGLG
ncbi:MAG: hypothetical protein WDZ51_13280 [Pirellulaceae bacterium]